MGKAPSASAPPLACPKNHHKKLDKKRNKIDKRSHLFSIQSNIKIKAKKIEQRRPLSGRKEEKTRERKREERKINKDAKRKGKRERERR